MSISAIASIRAGRRSPRSVREAWNQVRASTGLRVRRDQLARHPGPGAAHRHREPAGPADVRGSCGPRRSASPGVLRRGCQFRNRDVAEFRRVDFAFADRTDYSTRIRVRLEARVAIAPTAFASRTLLYGLADIEGFKTVGAGTERPTLLGSHPHPGGARLPVRPMVDGGGDLRARDPVEHPGGHRGDVQAPYPADAAGALHPLNRVRGFNALDIPRNRCNFHQASLLREAIARPSGRSIITSVGPTLVTRRFSMSLSARGARTSLIMAVLGLGACADQAPVAPAETPIENSVPASPVTVSALRQGTPRYVVVGKEGNQDRPPRRPSPRPGARWSARTGASTCTTSAGYRRRAWPHSRHCPACRVSTPTSGCSGSRPSPSGQLRKAAFARPQGNRPERCVLLRLSVVPDADPGQ